MSTEREFEGLDRLQRRTVAALFLLVALRAYEEIGEPAAPIAFIAFAGGHFAGRRPTLLGLARTAEFDRLAARCGGALHFLARVTRTGLLGTGGFHDFDIAGMTADDLVELGKRLQLIGNNAAHRFGALARLVRQLEYAALELDARLFQRALHFLRHLAYFARGVGEAFLQLREHLLHLIHRLFIGRLEGGGGAAALLGIGAADGFVLLVDRERDLVRRVRQRGARSRERALRRPAATPAASG